MESMDNREFDRKIKTKLEHFEAPVPLGLWDEIEQKLETGEGSFVEVSIVKRPKPIGSLKRIILIYGSIAAMFFVAFLFWNNKDTGIIYLESKPAQANIAPVEVPEVTREGSQEIFEPATEKVVVVVERLVKSTERKLSQGVYARLKDVETLVTIEPAKENNLTGQVPQVGLIESELALTPAGTVVEREEVLSLTREDLELASQESGRNAEGREHSEYEEVKSLRNKKIGVSTVLNFLAKGFSGERGNSIEFSENEEGILKWDIKSSLAKTPQ